MMTARELAIEFQMTERLVEWVLGLNPEFKTDDERRMLLRAHVYFGISTTQSYVDFINRR